MHQPSEFANKVGVPVFYFKSIDFFLSIKKVLSFYAVPFFIFGLYVVLFGKLGGIFPALFGIEGVFGGGFYGFAFQFYLYNTDITKSAVLYCPTRQYKKCIMRVFADSLFLLF
ncbi:hypothetical protein PYG29_01940 [Snodgrassella communis]|nr:hypothetical protein [Snodgrassella communis]WMY92157.1 hypothetical protein PYG29_01940 [Snodgrassella communis]